MTPRRLLALPVLWSPFWVLMPALGIAGLLPGCEAVREAQEPVAVRSSEVLPLLIPVVDRVERWSGSPSAIQAGWGVLGDLSGNEEVPLETLTERLLVLCLEHDRLARGQPDLIPGKLDTYLRSTAVLRTLIE